MTLKRLVKTVLNVKGLIVKKVEAHADEWNVVHLIVHADVRKRLRNRCPHCGKKCSGYDRAWDTERTWRALDWGGILVEIRAMTNRVFCKEHGVVTAGVPWAYPKSPFTKDFDLQVAWLAKALPRKAVSELMRVDWHTVGNCVKRALDDLEPDIRRRLDNLVRIGIDETSYTKGHNYVTVIVNHDTNEVVWIAKGHGKKVLTEFYKMLTDEQRGKIKVVTGDGARWITDCVREFTPECTRCVDGFHVIGWSNDMVNEVRVERWRDAVNALKKLKSGAKPKRGRPAADDKTAQKIKEAQENADALKGMKLTLGKGEEKLSPKERATIDMIRATDPKLFRAYSLKEALRAVLRADEPEHAKEMLSQWIRRASHFKSEAVRKLCEKIKRNRDFILNTVSEGMSNARIEATNNKIKVIIRRSYGFRNIDNLMAMVYLVCSNINIPLPNRGTKRRKAA